MFVFACLFLMISSTSDLSFFVSLNPLAATSKNFQEESIVPHGMDVVYVHTGTESFISYAMKHERVLWHDVLLYIKMYFCSQKLLDFLDFCYHNNGFLTLVSANTVGYEENPVVQFIQFATTVLLRQTIIFSFRQSNVRP